MSERCNWPKCRQPSACSYRYGSKVWHLCDQHGDLVQDEDERTMRRARKKIGMPLPERYPGRMLRMSENARCSFPKCRYPASLVRYRQDGKHAPLCGTHKDAENYEWDGVWHEFILGCGLDPKPMNQEESVRVVVPPVEVQEEKVAVAPVEEDDDADDADFSDFEARLASGSYDWEDE